jgi:hypothetical protein
MYIGMSVAELAAAAAPRAGDDGGGYSPTQLAMSFGSASPHNASFASSPASAPLARPQSASGLMGSRHPSASFYNRSAAASVRAVHAAASFAKTGPQTRLSGAGSTRRRSVTALSPSHSQSFNASASARRQSVSPPGAGHGGSHGRQRRSTFKGAPPLPPQDLPPPVDMVPRVELARTELAVLERCEREMLGAQEREAAAVVAAQRERAVAGSLRDLVRAKNRRIAELTDLCERLTRAYVLPKQGLGAGHADGGPGHADGGPASPSAGDVVAAEMLDETRIAPSSVSRSAQRIGAAVDHDLSLQSVHSHSYTM